jgi:hypothetical protein
VRWSFVVGLFLPLLLSLGARSALAAPDTPAQPTSSEPEARKQQAKEHFLRGLEFARKDQNYDAALAEFLASRELYPTQVALLNAAISLTRLGRYDEALQMYGELFELFGPGMTPEERALANDEMAELQKRLGELELEVNEPESSVEVDGRPRGHSPLPAPLRVASGSHAVRVSKPGFVPFQDHVVVASQQRRKLVVKLERSASLASVPTPAPPVVAQAPAAPRPERPPPVNPPAFHVSASVGVLWAASLAGGAAEACGQSVSHEGTELPGCRDRERPLGPVVRASLGYEVLPGLELHLGLGYLRASEALTRSLVATGEEAREYPSTDYRDRTELSALLAMLGVGHRFQTPLPLELRLGVGVARTTLEHHNEGTFAITVRNSSAPSESYSGTEHVSIPETSATSWLPVFWPDVRVGIPLTRRLSLDLGLGLLLLFGSSDARSGATSLSGADQRRTALADVPDGFGPGSEVVRPGVLALPLERRLGLVVGFTPSLGGRFDL